MCMVLKWACVKRELAQAWGQGTGGGGLGEAFSGKMEVDKGKVFITAGWGLRDAYPKGRIDLRCQRSMNFALAPCVFAP